MQLNTLLLSMARHIKCDNYTIDILYNVSSDEFAQGYNQLIQANQTNSHIHFIQEKTISPKQLILEAFHAGSKSEIKYFINTFRKKKSKTNFRKILLSLLKDNSSSDVMFLTDDACFIEKTNIDNEIVEWINADPYNRQFSLRTGKGMNEEPQGIKSVNNYLEWEYYNYPFFTLWGYPFSVDAHIYNKAVIIKALNNCYFNNPNSFEGFVSKYAQKKRYFGRGRAFTKTRILSFPINMVQSIANNESLNISVERLNNYYLKGYTLEYPIPDSFTTFQQYPDSLIFNHPQEENIIISTQ